MFLVETPNEDKKPFSVRIAVGLFVKNLVVFLRKLTDFFLL